jgi:TetR/AcrR family transcriptional repressor of mexJK operon
MSISTAPRKRPAKAASAQGPVLKSTSGAASAKAVKAVKASKSAPVAHRGAGRPRAEEVEARLEALRHTAAQLFMTHGYGKVSLEMIAREARVAIRTIYVKFGGKAGLVAAMIEAKREVYLSGKALLTDPRPVREVLGEFARQLHRLLQEPDTQALRRMIVAEGEANPELVDSFYRAGPGITHELLNGYLARADVRRQLREDLPFDQLSMFFTNCVIGDTLMRKLGCAQSDPSEAALEARMTLFFRAVMR